MKYSHLFRATKYIWDNQRKLIVVSLLFSVVLGVSPYWSLLVTKNLLNEITSLFSQSGNSFNNVIKYVFLQFGVQILISVLSYMDSYYENKFLLVLGEKLNIELFDKMKEIPLIVFDDPNFHNHLSRIDNLAEMYWAPFKATKDLVKTLINIFSYALILLTVHWIILIICLFAAIPMFVVNSKISKESFGLLVANSSINKEMHFLSYLMKNKQYAKELKLFGLHSFFISRWSKKYVENSNKVVLMEKKHIKYNLLGETINSIFYIACSIFIIVVLMKTKNVLVGNFVITNQSLVNIQGSFNKFAALYAQLKTSSYFLEDQHKFMETSSYHERGNISLSAPPSHIILQNVSFKYPNHIEFALKNITLSIKKGDRVAILGANGSGKSTLIKCMVGLYREYEGGIFIDGLNQKLIEELTLYKKVSIIFQDYIKYPFTIKENILFGDVDREEDITCIEESCMKTQMHTYINKLPKKYDTYLGNYLEQGVDLSEGQWQKIAISRALYRDSEIIIMDEPTSSLDSESEAMIYKDLLNNNKDKTIIFVSHRIATAELADLIVIMKEGEIIEQGSHNELIEKRGEYFRLTSMKKEYSKS